MGGCGFKWAEVKYDQFAWLDLHTALQVADHQQVVGLCCTPHGGLVGLLEVTPWPFLQQVKTCPKLR